MKPESQSHLQPWNLFNKPRSQASPILFVAILLVISLEVIESKFLVKTLPGFRGDLPFMFETGYIGVGESEDVQLFYYFIESERNPEDDPLVLWLTGGPGCSGLSSILHEIGPLAINYAESTPEKPILEINPYSWTKAANIIFLDQPAGAGFSYAKTSEAYIMNDTLSAMQTYHFLRKWLVDHPKFLNNPLYVGGESYCGIIVPMVVEKIYNGIEAGEGPKMTIKGYMLGNPLTEKRSNYNSRLPYAHHVALISDALFKSVKENCHEEYLEVDPNNIPCANDLQVIGKCLERIFLENILEPVCEGTSNSATNLLRRDLSSLDRIFDGLGSLPQFHKQWCRFDNYIFSYNWANNKYVREALHNRKEFNNIEWVVWNESLKFDYDKEDTVYTHNIQSTVDFHRQLTDKNCRALIYSGDHDMVVPYLNTLDWIESLNLSVTNDWRPWFVKGQVAGYTMKYLKRGYNLTFATIKGAGHTAPEYKPEQCLSLLIRWFANDAL